jgi:hypothetical protein
MANTIGSQVWREKYAKATLENALRNNLVAEAICKVDRSDVKVIKSPYMTAPTVTVQAVAGTYSPADFVTTNDTLTVTDEFIVSEHIMDFQSALSDFDLFAARMDDMMANVAIQIDRFVLNNLTEDGTGSYTTPAGGFTTAANINQIFGDLVAKVAGYSDAYNNLFVVIENTDLPGLMVAGATNGFMVADQVIKNGKVGSWMGVDIYVVRSGTFASETLGTTTYTNSGHRVFGVKGVATYAAPRGVQYEEKAVSGKTGKEIAVYGYCGFKLWTPKAGLIVDITLA